MAAVETLVELVTCPIFSMLDKVFPFSALGQKLCHAFVS
jgi:hypothetical protein